ncbi:Creatinine amidohydrolase [Gracilaria domingensis]|nr:Creatinine amidohydrolase [Gracilaria domingensis]
MSNMNQWEYLSSPEISGLQMAILPLGSIESHGPHLPLGTDAILASELASKAAEGLTDIAILPLSYFGASFEHLGFPGTIGIRDDILNSYWGDITTSIVRAGLKKVLLVNGHGGQTSNVQIVIRNARFEHNVLAVSFNVQAMLAKAYGELVEVDLSSDEVLKGIHGGLIETSVMLHLHPELVQVDKLRDFRPKTISHIHLEPYGAIVSYGWRMEDLCAEGAVGNARGSSAELGSRIFSRSVLELRGVMEDMLRSDLKELLVMKGYS